MDPWFPKRTLNLWKKGNTLLQNAVPEEGWQQGNYTRKNGRGEERKVKESQ